jgi:hypothetical protein
MRIIEQDLGKLGVGAIVETLNRREARADEQGLQYYLIPRRLVKDLARVGIALRDRLEDRLHGRAHAFRGHGEERRRVGKEREPAQKSEASESSAVR